MFATRDAYHEQRAAHREALERGTAAPERLALSVHGHRASGEHRRGRCSPLCRESSRAKREAGEAGAQAGRRRRRRRGTVPAAQARRRPAGGDVEPPLVGGSAAGGGRLGVGGFGRVGVVGRRACRAARVHEAYTKRPCPTLPMLGSRTAGRQRSKVRQRYRQRLQSRVRYVSKWTMLVLDR